MIDLVITGTIGLDDVETPFGKVKSVLGGSGIYAAVAASYFARPGLVSIVGKDKGEKKLSELKKIDTEGVARSGKTFKWSGCYEYDMNEAKTLKTELNSLSDFTPVLPPAYQKSKFLMLGNTDPEIQLNILSQMTSKPFVVLDTMNYWIEKKKDSLGKVIRKINMLVLNEGEAREFCKTPNLIRAGKLLLDMGPKYVIIKKGEHGALLFSRSKFFSAPSYPLEELKDPTGAGDSFAGALTGYLSKAGGLSEKNIRKAIIFGSIIASFCAENFSIDYHKKVTTKEIKERYAAIQKIREF